MRHDNYGSRFKYGKKEVKKQEVLDIPELQDQNIPAYSSHPIATRIVKSKSFNSVTVRENASVMDLIRCSIILR